MLFDLRSRGRRTTVKVIYTGLAILIGVGLVGFGIGGGLGASGLFNALGTNNGSSQSTFSSQIAKDQKVTREHPNSAAAWDQLATDLYRQAGTGSNYNTTSDQFTTQSHGLLQQISQAWQQYLTLNPNNPDPTLAQYMVFVYGGTQSDGLTNPSAELAAEQIVIGAATQPSAQQYLTLADIAYSAKNVREGDLAGSKAIALSPSSQRAELRTYLKQLKADPAAVNSQPSSTSANQTFSVNTSSAAASSSSVTASSATASSSASTFTVKSSSAATSKGG